jgi:hypothetical protein
MSLFRVGFQSDQKYGLFIVALKQFSFKRRRGLFIMQTLAARSNPQHKKLVSLYAKGISKTCKNETVKGRSLLPSNWDYSLG